MAPCVTGLGYDWVTRAVRKALEELIALIGHEVPSSSGNGQQHFSPPAYQPPPITITCDSADHLAHVADGSVDAVVLDPPYYDNVMYAGLADFFYVWLKRTAGLLFPEPLAPMSATVRPGATRNETSSSTRCPS